MNLSGDGADQDLEDIFAAERQARFAHHQDARGSRLQHAQSAARPNAELGHAPDPARFAVHFGNIGLLASP